MIIRNGRVIDPVGGQILEADLIIRDGQIYRLIRRDLVSPEDSVSSGDIVVEKDYIGIDEEAIDAEVIDAEGLLIGPGLADTHVHFRDPGFTYKEDILTGAEAAKAGGYTQIVLMANTNPKVDNEDTLRYVLEKGLECGIHINTCANVTVNMEGKELTDMPHLKDLGAVGFTDDGVPIVNSDICFEAMRKCALLNVPISFHEENPDLIANNGINRGAASEFLGVGGSPREAEIDLIRRDIELGRKVLEESGLSPCLVIQHISTKEGVILVSEGRKSGLNIHAEATPHHFSLTEQAVIEHGTLAKMNPPLRTEEDREAICEGLKRGDIDLIATDHAPHSLEEKARSITEAPSGIIGLETALGLAIRELVNKGYLSYPQLFERMSLSPCRLYGLVGGTVEEGSAADLVIFNPEEEWEVKEFKSKSSNSPFVGQTLPGKIKYTICGGKVVFSQA